MTQEQDPAYQEGKEAGYRLAISDLEAALREDPYMDYAIDHLTNQADDYWPPEEIT